MARYYLTRGTDVAVELSKEKNKWCSADAAEHVCVVSRVIVKGLLGRSCIRVASTVRVLHEPKVVRAAVVYPLEVYPPDGG